MNTQPARLPPLRGYRRRKAVLDLNVPACEIRDREGTSTGVRSVEVVTSQQEQQLTPDAPIDVEAIDDDVIESSPRAFAEAKNNSRRNRSTRTTVIVDVDSEGTTRMMQNNRNKRRRTPIETIINCELINLESASNTSERVTRFTAPLPPPPPPPPPKEPTFTCPICMGPFVDETSTKCGHIFCKKCIRSAVAVQNKCPTCRKRIVLRELIRVFLPATTS